MTTAGSDSSSERPVSRRIAGNAASLLAARGAGMAVSFLFGIYVVRALGVAEFGRYSVLMATYALLTIFVNLGLDSLVVREIARSRGVSRALFGSVLRLKLVSSGLCLAVLAVGPALVGPERPLGLPLLLVGLALVLDAVCDSVALVFLGHERFGVPSLLGLAGGLLFAAFGVAALLAGGASTALFVALVAAKLIQASASGAALRLVHGDDAGRQPPEPGHRGALALAAAAVPFFFAKLFYLVYFRIDMLMLDAMAGEESVGYYGAAYKFVNLATALAGAFAAALFPVMAASGGDRARFHRLFTDSLRYLTILGLPIAAVVWYAARDLLVLLFTEEYAPAAPALRVLTWAVLAVFANLVFSNALISLDRERWAVPIGAAAVGANVALNLLLIPRLAEQGAAVATLASELLVVALYAALLVRGEIARSAARMAVRLLPCAAALLVPLMLLRSAPWPLGVLVAVASYAIVLFAAGLARPRDFERMRAMVRPAEAGR